MEFMRRNPSDALLPLLLMARVATPLTLTNALSRPTSVGRTTELSFLNTSPGSLSTSCATARALVRTQDGLRQACLLAKKQSSCRTTCC